MCFQQLLFRCSDNFCAITRSLYLEVLTSIVGGLDSSAFCCLDEDTSLQLHAFLAHSLAVCTSLSSAGQERGVACDESIVLQHVKLLQLSFDVTCGNEGKSDPPSVSNEEMPHAKGDSNTPCDEDTFEAFVSVLGCCKNSALLECVLESVSRWGRRERVTEALVGRAKEESDPDILVHVSMQLPLDLPLPCVCFFVVLGKRFMVTSLRMVV